MLATPRSMRLDAEFTKWKVKAFAAQQAFAVQMARAKARERQGLRFKPGEPSCSVPQRFSHPGATRIAAAGIAPCPAPPRGRFTC
jgi:hypothetical protein